MKSKFLIVLFSLLFQTFSVGAKPPLKNSLYVTPKIARDSRSVVNDHASKISQEQLSAENEASADCTVDDLMFAPNAAACNGVSVTPINFTNPSRTVFSGTDRVVGVVYKYANAGIAPDGTSVDAHVTVLSYNNNQDTDQTNFRSADLVGDETTVAGYDRNLQPNLQQESGVFANNGPWNAQITYQINFYKAGTLTPQRLTVAPISLDNDGATVSCNGLRETVTYGAADNRILINTAANTSQVITGNSITPNANTNQSGIGIGSLFANAALYINVTQFTWSYSFNTNTGNTCTQGSASSDRLGSLNMSCQITFDRNFATVAVSGNVLNDTNGLSGTPVNTVDGSSTNAGGLFASLVDASGFVVSSVAVASDGTYSFPNVPPNANYSVRISTTQGVESSFAPAASLPAGWTNTGEFIGTGAGNDGLPANGSINVTVATAAVSNVNFGIEQRPIANNNSTATQANPGGTINVTVPATNFTASDPVTNTVSNIRITAFPSNAASITIGGTNYTAANFPAGGVTVPTNAAGNPTQAITVDPVDGAVTVGIQYVAIDGANVQSAVPATVNVPFGAAAVSGNVFNDTNGLNGTPANTVDGSGTNAGGLFAILVNSTGNIAQSVAVAPGGAYSFPGVAAGTYTVLLSTTPGTVGAAAPIVSSLPVGWTSTGEFVGAGAGSDGTINGISSSFTVPAAGNVTNVNFGIEQRPVANNSTLASQANPGGVANVTVPATSFTATDSVTNTVSSIRITAFPTGATSITINGISYLPLTFPAGGVTVPTNAAGNPTQTILVDPTDAAAEVRIPYVAIDTAGIESAVPGTVIAPFGTASIAGNVFNDLNGLTDSTVNGAGTNAGGLFAILVNSTGNVAQSVAVTANGAYSFPGVAVGTYTVRLSTAAGTIGATAPAVSLPSGWASTGESVTVEVGSDGTNDGTSSSLSVAATGTDVRNVNFGIEQRPTANNNTTSTINNPGGTALSLIPSTVFSATDPAGGTVTSIRITAFPSNTTTIRINDVNYTSTTFPAGGVTVLTNAAGNPTQPIFVDPNGGTVTVVIPYVAIDNAGIETASPATATVPFAVGPTSSSAFISGSLMFGETPIRKALVVLTNINTGGSKVIRTDANGVYRFEEQVGVSYIIQPVSNKYSFSPANRFVDLRDDTLGENFASTAKTYRAKNDFDGDGKSDQAVYRASEGNWYILQSSNDEMRVFNFGLESDVPVSADFDGDGKTDVAVFRPSDGNWYISESSTQNLRVVRFGLASDKLVPADYDGDGKADVAVYRSGVWYINQSSTNSLKVVNWGVSSDTPFAQDFDGDGKADQTAYRSTDGTWYVLQSATNNWKGIRFGLTTDVPVAADYDGDGMSDAAQFRDGFWYVLNSVTGFQGEQFGQANDQTIRGDYDGDGRADFTVFNNGNWSIRNSFDGTTKTISFGLATDILVK